MRLRDGKCEKLDYEEWHMGCQHMSCTTDPESRVKANLTLSGHNLTQPNL